ncbi:MAG TPA: O-antigen ligase family protein [Vicinamibacterales bacterium]|nr:O-antigen ligase family protein [Vicinamibacterales bacterium]
MKQLRPMLLAFLFVLFLYPVSVGEYSVNYSFVLYPALVVLVRQRFHKPPPLIVAGITIYLFILGLSIVYFPDMIGQTLRRLASFAIFMAAFAFAFVRVDTELVTAFKRAIIISSVYFSASAIFAFLGLQAIGPVDFEAKDAVGSQRFGFIYIVAFWLALLDRRQTIRPAFLNYLAVPIIFAGLFLTFSRSAFVSLGVSLAVFGLAQISDALVRSTPQFYARLVAIGLVLALASVMVTRFFPLTIEYYTERLITPFAEGALVGTLSDPDSSEGIRVVRFNEGLDFVLRHPLTGNGYLGIWTFSPSGGGSAHNQYLDTFIRVGFIGLAYYVYLLSRLLRFLRRYDAPLFWGVVGILVYGMFHETFKESQGAVVLAMLIGMMAQHIRESAAGTVSRTWHDQSPRRQRNGRSPKTSPAANGPTVPPRAMA